MILFLPNRLSATRMGRIEIVRVLRARLPMDLLIHPQVLQALMAVGGESEEVLQLLFLASAHSPGIASVLGGYFQIPDGTTD